MLSGATRASHTSRQVLARFHRQRQDLDVRIQAVRVPFRRHRGRSRRRAAGRSCSSRPDRPRRTCAGTSAVCRAPSVTEMITTLACSPRSNRAGQTRLPTFSMKSSEPGADRGREGAGATIGASRWQPAPVLIWIAGAGPPDPLGVEGVSWSPSMTGIGGRRRVRRWCARAARSCPSRVSSSG